MELIKLNRLCNFGIECDMDIIPVPFYSLGHQLRSDTKHVAVIPSKKDANQHVAGFLG